MINHFDIKWCLLHEGNKSVRNETLLFCYRHIIVGLNKKLNCRLLVTIFIIIFIHFDRNTC